MMKNVLIIAVALLCIQCGAKTQDAEDTFTIYLVRHTEKEIVADNPDPALTLCGQQRAQSFAEFFSAVDLETIYSSDYIRTMKTAEPTANNKNLAIESYNPGELETFSKLLIDQGKDALVVGHSNTTGVLAGLLIGEEMGSFEEHIYNRIYQVVIYKRTGRLHLLHTSFTCEE